MSAYWQAGEWYANDANGMRKAQNANAPIRICGI